MTHRSPRLLTALFSALLLPLLWAKPFTGTLVYKQSAVGGDGAKAFKNMAAEKITVHIGTKAYRQDEHGGLYAGSAIVRLGSPFALRLNATKKTSELGRANRIEDLSPKMRKMMPHHFHTPLEATGETEKIAGYTTKKYKILRSPFVKTGATAHIWVAEELEIGRHRYDFQFRAARFTSPLPQSIPVDKGTILKVVVLEKGTTVTVVVSQVTVGEPAASLFIKPANYAGQDFPAPLKPMPTPTGPIPDVSQLAATITNSANIKLLLVKPGTFTMGCPPEDWGRKPKEQQCRVTLTRAFYLATTEVTQAQWKAVMGTESPSNFKGKNLPVEQVTWQDAMAFCKKLSEKEGQTYRLPTEAEWEFAARAGAAVQVMDRKQRTAWLKERAWTRDTADYQTHPVGTKKPNPWGFFDMLGNVNEYTLSGMGDYPEGTATDPQGMQNEMKVTRGGGWIGSADWARPTARASRKLDTQKSTIGFRILYVPK